MTRDDIIAMAREAGILETMGYGNPHMKAWQADVVRELTHFAALIASRVAAHVRETEFKPDWNNYRQGFADGAAEEREACAKVCDDEYFAFVAADTIRARGETSSRGQT